MRGSKLFFAAAFSSAVSTLACGHASLETAAPVQPAAAAKPAAPATAVSPEPTPRTTPTEDPYVSAAPIAAKSIGHTSYVLKVTLEGGAVAAYKPGSTLPLGKHRYKGEIAAYRLARALGLDNVPQAMPRAFSAAALRSAFPTPKGAADFDRKAIVDTHGLVHGALMPWITDYRILPLEDVSWRARWESWLMAPAARIPVEQESLAASISTMILFDYVTANWDRWSGGNVAREGADGRLLFVDNDGAFYEHPAEAPLAAQLEVVHRVVRCSQSFIAALRAIDHAKLREAMGDDTPGTQLLSDRVISGVETRIKTVLADLDGRGVKPGFR
jgi:hypothetical protein